MALFVAQHVNEKPATKFCFKPFTLWGLSRSASGTAMSSSTLVGYNQKATAPLTLQVVRCHEHLPRNLSADLTVGLLCLAVEPTPARSIPTRLACEPDLADDLVRGRVSFRRNN